MYKIYSFIAPYKSALSQHPQLFLCVALHNNEAILLLLAHAQPECVSTPMLTLAYLSRGAGDGRPLTGLRGVPEKPLFFFLAASGEKKEHVGNPTSRTVVCPLHPTSGGGRAKSVSLSETRLANVEGDKVFRSKSSSLYRELVPTHDCQPRRKRVDRHTYQSQCLLDVADDEKDAAYLSMMHCQSW